MSAHWEWFPAVPGLVEKLRDGGRVADLGCGEGWSSIAMALGFAEVTVEGFDIDADSVDAARRHAQEAFECIHDLPDPVGVLRSMRELAKPGGMVMVMDERVPETYTGQPGDPVEQLMYGFSLTVCLPDGLSTSPSRATGTVMRPSVLREYALEAGFDDVEVLPIEHDLWRFYRLLG